MFSKSVVKSGLTLAGITLILFFGLYLTYFSSAVISDRDYFSYSAIIICFVLPILYAGFGFYEILKIAREESPTFRQGFRVSFITLIIGGLISTIIIFLFFNTLGDWAQENLKYEWFDTQTEMISKADIEEEDRTKRLSDIEQMKEHGGNLFSFVFFMKFTLALILFYLAISAILAMFMKNRRV